MLAEIGQFTLAFGMLVSLLLTAFPIYGYFTKNENLMHTARPLAYIQLIFILASFLILVALFIVQDFTVTYVWQNSNMALPLRYRISATWGAHEGSMLLWLLIQTIWTAAVAFFSKSLSRKQIARVLAVLGIISLGFTAFVFFMSNPFLRTIPAPFDGNDLNPLLQDVGLIIHPPILYMGYVGLSVPFAISIAALIGGKIDESWIRWSRPWTNAAWGFLTFGIVLGSWWAYYELGWGGWWFWDPVENASFMPWIVGTALLHSSLVVERRQALVVWTVLLAILTFSLSLIGTFLVRSGVLTSVHAFASDPSRGFGVLIILVLAAGGGLTLFSIRAQKLGSPVLFSPVSREGGLVLNNILLVTAAGTVFLGTFYPLFFEMLTGDKISVGAPFFNQTFVPIMIPLLLVVVVGTVMRWKRDKIGRAFKQLKLPALLTLAAIIVLLVAGKGAHPAASVGIGLGVWLVVGTLAGLISRFRLLQVPMRRSLSLATNTPRAVYGMVLAHVGLGLAVIGITTVSAFEQERILAISPGETIPISGFEFKLDRIARIKGDNYEAEQALFEVTRGGRPFTTMSSERRFYPVSSSVTTEAGIRPVFLSNLYVAIGERNDRGQWVVRIYFHPFALLIWIGPLLMALGGFVSLSDRRFRVGAPQKSKIPPKPVEAV
jgi:cytochrome c-type biogenesis protein CcmF